MHDFYRGYIPIRGKQATVAFSDPSTHITLEAAQKLPEYAGVLAEDTVLIDVDDPEQAETLLDIIEEEVILCRVYKTNRGYHFLFKNNGNFKKCKSRVTLACGIVADIKLGNNNSYEVLKYKGEEREIDYDILEDEEYQTAPQWLTPTDNKENLWRKSDGEGRNDAIRDHILSLCRAKVFKDNGGMKSLELLNKYVFKSPLPTGEFETVTRSEMWTTKGNIEKPTIINARWLGGQDLKPIEFIVPGLLPVGLNILASPPKFGKSWLALDLCLDVAMGKEFLGYETKEKYVCYLALEDSENRMQTRIKQLLDQGENFPFKLNIVLRVNDLSHGLIEQLNMILDEYPMTKLFVIDTLQYIRGQHNRNDGAYSADYSEMKVLKQFADDHKICVLVIHHTKKDTNPNDPFANISGTNGITGAMDTMWVLSKNERTDIQTKLSITGRDVEMNEYYLTFENGRWEITGEVKVVDEDIRKAQYTMNPIIQTIKRAVEESEKKEWRGKISELKELSKEYGCEISESSVALGRNIKRFDLDLAKNDGIRYRSIDNGSGSRIHVFSK